MSETDIFFSCSEKSSYFFFHSWCEWHSGQSIIKSNDRNSLCAHTKHSNKSANDAKNDRSLYSSMFPCLFVIFLSFYLSFCWCSSPFFLPIYFIVPCLIYRIQYLFMLDLVKCIVNKWNKNSNHNKKRNELVFMFGFYVVLRGFFLVLLNIFIIFLTLLKCVVNTK